MSQVYLTRIDPAQNMARFYALAVQPTLFGEWALVREWGRIGQGGHIESAAFQTQGEADLALAREFRRKVRDGYGVLKNAKEANVVIQHCSTTTL